MSALGSNFQRILALVHPHFDFMEVETHLGRNRLLGLVELTWKLLKMFRTRILSYFPGD